MPLRPRGEPVGNAGRGATGAMRDSARAGATGPVGAAGDNPEEPDGRMPGTSDGTRKGRETKGVRNAVSDGPTFS